jgi:hypothetical protein
MQKGGGFVMPRNNKQSRKAQASRPWSGTPTRPRRKDEQPGEARQIRRGRSRTDRRLSVRSELRQEPDVRRIARAVIELAMAQAEADAANDSRTVSPEEEAPEVSS